MNDDILHILKEILPFVNRPGRYLGIESMAVHKNRNEVELHVALLLPDTYEIGMSNTGLKMLYHIINRRTDAWAERAYAPWTDMAALMKHRRLPLHTLESKTPLRDLDMVGISLQTEQTYINIPYVLELAHIPIWAADRGAGDPLIIAGGPCTANPEPVAPFFDGIVIGDGEAVIEHILDRIKEGKKAHRSREAIIASLSELVGFYAPRHHPGGPLLGEDMPAPITHVIRKTRIPSLDDYSSCGHIILPVIDIVQDRLGIEIARGCTRGCRFCQAGFFYRPLRERQASTLFHQAVDGIRRSGLEEVALLSLSSSDYSEIMPLARALQREFEHHNISISLPSLRADKFSIDLAQAVKDVRKAGFTFAPEAGTERLRRIINKNISDDEILNSAEIVFRSDWNLVKLYFMIGLPGETEEDLRAVATLSRKIASIGRRINRRNRVTLSVGNFVPKPFTPFQWESMESIENLHHKITLLKKWTHAPGLDLKWDAPYVSHIEAMLSRGDRRLAGVIHDAYRKGAVFDGWEELFNDKAWQDAISENHLDSSRYLNRLELDAPLPWDFVDIGVTKRFLQKEHRKAHQDEAELTSDCRTNDCHACGLPEKCDITRFSKPLEPGPVSRATSNPLSGPSSIPALHMASEVTSHPALNGISPPENDPPQKAESPHIRIYYEKMGLSIFLSHNDVIKLMQRALRTTGVALQHTLGFHKRLKITAGPAIPLGIESEEEYIDIFPLGPLPEDFHDRLNRHLPTGLRVVRSSTVTGYGDPVPPIKKTDYIVHFSQSPDLPEAVLDGLKAFHTRLRAYESTAVKVGDNMYEIEPPHGKYRLLYQPKDGSHFFLRIQILQGENQPPSLFNTLYQEFSLPEEARGIISARKLKPS